MATTSSPAADTAVRPLTDAHHRQSDTVSCWKTKSEMRPLLGPSNVAVPREATQFVLHSSVLRFFRHGRVG